MKKITSPITAATVVKPDDAPAAPPPFGEATARPETLLGATYRVKTPLSDHALYITVNDIIVHPDTEHEQRRPFEVFINSKNMDHFQWIVALTRVMSAVFRKGGDVALLVEELRSVFDPKGGYFKKGGKYMPSLVSEIGDVLERHLTGLGMIDPPAPLKTAVVETAAEPSADGGFPPTAELCKECMTKALVIMDGCQTCLACGNSKCS